MQDPTKPPTLLGKGLAFPINLAVRGGLRVEQGSEKVYQSIYLILATAPGERIMRPDFGCGIHDLVFWPNTASLRGLVEEKVREALIRWEPRIDVIAIEVTTDSDLSDRLLIRLDYRIRENNSTHNFVYPFYLQDRAG